MPPFDDGIPKVKQQENAKFISKELSGYKITDWASRYMLRTECTDKFIKQDKIDNQKVQEIMATEEFQRMKQQIIQEMMATDN